MLSGVAFGSVVLHGGKGGRVRDASSSCDSSVNSIFPLFPPPPVLHTTKLAEPPPGQKAQVSLPSRPYAASIGSDPHGPSICFSHSHAPSISTFSSLHVCSSAAQTSPCMLSWLGVMVYAWALVQAKKAELTHILFWPCVWPLATATQPPHQPGAVPPAISALPERPPSVPFFKGFPNPQLPAASSWPVACPR